jgi:hypothetical protein
MLSDLDVLQRGKQTAFGTANTAATAILQNVSSFSLTPEFEARTIGGRIGSLAPAHESALDMVKSSATFEAGDETFEDINYWLDSLFSAAVASGTGPYVREYAAPLTAAVIPSFMSLKWGQSGSMFLMPDASLTSLKITGETNGGVQVGGSLIGGAVSPTTLNTLSIRTGQTRMTGCQASIAIDPWSGNMGDTAIEDCAFSYELTINSNRAYRGYLGKCYAAAWHDKKWDAQLRISMEIATDSSPFLTEMLGTPNALLKKQIQIQHKTGTGTNERSMTIQFAGHTVQAPQLFQERDGVKSIDLVFDGVYNSTFGNWLKMETKSAIQTLV